MRKTVDSSTKMQFHRKSKRRKKQQNRFKFHNIKLKRGQLLHRKNTQKSLPANEASESAIQLRRAYYPYYLRKRPFWSSRRRYDQYDDLDYDYILPMKFSTRNFYYDDLYEDEEEYNRRTYFPFKRGYGYRNGGYQHKPSSYNLFPFLTMFGIIGLLLNFGLGKLIDENNLQLLFFII